MKLLKNSWFWIGVLVVGVLSLLFFMWAIPAGASQEDKVYWCHVEPNGNQQTLHLPLQALQQAGHVNAQGNPLHAGDHAGVCTITVTPTPFPSVTAVPTNTLTPTFAPSPTSEPSATLTPTNSPKPTDVPNTGDGLGCATHDCSTHPTPTYPTCDVPRTCGFK